MCVQGLKLLVEEGSGIDANSSQLFFFTDRESDKRLEEGTLDAPLMIKDIPGIQNGTTLRLAC